MWHETGVGIEAHRSYGVERWVEGVVTHASEAVAEEVPVALVYNGVSHAVMLATPLDLDDFALGFSLSECIVKRPGEIYELDVFERDNGIEVHMELSGERAQALKAHRRTLAGRTPAAACAAPKASISWRKGLRPCTPPPFSAAVRWRAPCPNCRPCSICFI